MKTMTGLTMVVVAGAFFACFGPVAPAGAVPPDPDNAALLYYQAFLLVPQTDDRAVRDLVGNVALGTVAPNDQVKEHMKKCQEAIECAVAASQLQQCSWGLRYSKGFSAAFPHLAQARSLAWLVLADARVRAAEGNYRPALERCLAVQRMAGHVGDETLISLLVSIAVDAQANKCVTALLEQMPAEGGTLTWLKDQLALAPAAKLSAQRSLNLEEEISLGYLRPERIAELPALLSDPSDMSAEEIRQVVNEEVLARARAHYSSYKGSALAILSGQAPYGESYAKLQELTKQMEREATKDPAVKLITVLAPAMMKVYVLQVRHQADVNALQAALDVYLAKAVAGRLPQTLPAAAPRDPYTGSAFQYEPTATGFVLRCGAKDLDKNEVRTYEFKVK